MFYIYNDCSRYVLYIDCVGFGLHITIICMYELIQHVHSNRGSKYDCTSYI